MLIDKVRVDFIAGSGGSGSVNFHKNGKPDGGDGGHGGDIYLVGDENIYDLRNFNKREKFQADDGGRGGYNKRTGANGNDLLIKVPLITKVYDLAGRELEVIDIPGQKKLLIKGSAGGKGNYYFRKGQTATLRKFTPGKKGKKLQVFLELELRADIVFVGLPNAGKSSMLNILTNTNVKVANYPFTTLVPYLGLMGSLKLMDLPGLIEGTAKGKGLGSGFSKHIRNTKGIAHFLSLEEKNLEQSYNIIRRELSEINPELLEKPEILVLTKSDNFSESELKIKLSQAKKFHKKIVLVSIINDSQISDLRKSFERLEKYSNF